MEGLAVLPHLRQSASREREPQTQLLLADGDAAARSLMASRVRDLVEELAVLEAEDGSEALRVGLQHRPELALLDVDMPRLGGIDVAITLRELHPQVRLALLTADPAAHRDSARVRRLPLFDKLEPDRPLDWLRVQAQACTTPAGRVGLPHKRILECSACGYGIAGSMSPERCPMCQREGTWIHTPWRPFRRG